MSKIFRIIFICSIIIYSSCDDACAAHKKADCASDTTNNCEWTTTTAAGCASSCVTKAKGECSGTCTWTAETGTCSDKTFACASIAEDKCGAVGEASEGFCEWDTEVEPAACVAVDLECSDKDVDACATASDTCNWSKTADGSCGISGSTDSCTANTKEEDCTGDCSWIEEVGTCSTKTTNTNGGDNNDKNSCGFLKMSLSIFVLVLFL